MPEQTAPLDTWAIVEVMGHRRYAGKVSEHPLGGVALIRVDVPETEQPKSWRGPERTTAAYSKLIGPSSIYCLTPCTEEVARNAARVIEADNDPIPVALPESRQIPARVGAEESEVGGDLSDDDDTYDIAEVF